LRQLTNADVSVPENRKYSFSPAVPRFKASDRPLDIKIKQVNGVGGDAFALRRWLDRARKAVTGRWSILTAGALRTCVRAVRPRRSDIGFAPQSKEPLRD
jgi:hypothetical protein